ncbi:MAG: tape measure protein [Ilumatobacteraceae bacterium]
MAEPIGRLFVAVDANVLPAMNKLRRLDAQAIRTANNLRALGRAGGGLIQASQSATKLSNAMRQTSTNASKAAADINKVGRSARGATSPMAGLTASMHRFSQAFINLRYQNPLGIIAGLAGGMGSLSGVMKGAVPAAGAAAGALAGIATAGAAVVAGGAAVASVLTFAIGKAGLEAASSIETLSIQFKGLLGSSEAAKEELKFLQEVAQESIIPTEDLFLANRQLLAFGVTSQQVRQNLVKFMSDYGSAAGLSTNQVQGLSYVMGQINAQGKAYTQDIKQLANASVGIDKLSKALGMSSEEFMKLVKDGKASADLMFKAIDKIGNDKSIQRAAEEARNSTAGIIANLKDMVQIGLGNAFQGALQKIQPIFKWLEEMIQAIDFTRIGKTFEMAFASIGEAFAGMEANAQSTASWFNDWIPAAIQRTIETVGLLIRIFRTMWEAGVWVVQNLTLAFNEFAHFTSGVLAGLAEAAATVLPAGFGDAADGVAKSMRRMETETRIAADNAAAAAITAAGNIDQIWSTPAYKALYYYITPIQAGINNGQIPEQANDPQPQWYKDMVARMQTPTLPTTTNTTGSSSGGSQKENPAFKRWQEWLAALKPLLEKVKSARAEIKGMLDQPFGTMSDLMKSLSFEGKDGNFQGDTDAIIANFAKAKTAIMDYYAVMVSPKFAGKKASEKAKRQRLKDVQALRTHTQQLVDLSEENKRLAEQLDKHLDVETKRTQAALDALERNYNGYRDTSGNYIKGAIEQAQSVLDQATKAYDDANSKLQDLIAARDEFLNGIRDSARSFVNALEVSSEMIATYTRLDDVGSFSMTEQEKNKTFRESLEERLKILKEWRDNITKLMASGLDSSLLQDLISAGPEASAGIVAEIANGGQENIDAINAIQGELAGVISSVQGQASAAWFDSGIANQQAVVNQLAAAKALAEQSLIDTERQYHARKQQLEAYMQVIEDQATEEAERLLAQMEANEKTAKDIAEKIRTQLEWLTNKKNPKNMTLLGEKAMEGLEKGLQNKEAQVLATAQKIADRIASTIRDALKISSPSRLMIQYGEWVSEGLAIGMESSLSKVEAASMHMAHASLPTIPSGGNGDTMVKVFIGETELRDIVDVQVSNADTRNGSYVMTGRRL